MALPEVEEHVTWGTDVNFRVRNKMFVIGGDEATAISLKASLTTQADLHRPRPGDLLEGRLRGAVRVGRTSISAASTSRCWRSCCGTRGGRPRRRSCAGWCRNERGARTAPRSAPASRSGPPGPRTSRRCSRSSTPARFTTRPSTPTAGGRRPSRRRPPRRRFWHRIQPRSEGLVAVAPDGSIVGMIELWLKRPRPRRRRADRAPSRSTSGSPSHPSGAAAASAAR